MADKTDQFIDSRLGVLVRRTREKMGMTQSDLADFAGLTQGYISHIERGARKSMSTLGNLRQIALSLDYESLGDMIKDVENLPSDHEILKEIQKRIK